MRHTHLTIFKSDILIRTKYYSIKFDIFSENYLVSVLKIILLNNNVEDKPNSQKKTSSVVFSFSTLFVFIFCRHIRQSNSRFCLMSATTPNIITILKLVQSFYHFRIDLFVPLYVFKFIFNLYSICGFLINIDFVSQTNEQDRWGRTWPSSCYEGNVTR